MAHAGLACCRRGRVRVSLVTHHYLGPVVDPIPEQGPPEAQILTFGVPDFRTKEGFICGFSGQPVEHVS
jgi:hypothetical protein